jgi:hypothetical protein
MNPPEHCDGFKTPIEVDRRKGDLEEFPVGGKFPDREIGEFQSSSGRGKEELKGEPYPC